MLPEDAWGPVRLGAPDGLIWGDDEVYPEVVEQQTNSALSPRLAMFLPPYSRLR